MLPMRTTVIKEFLNLKTWPDLANLYHIGMEVQVNVAQDNGERVQGDYQGKQWLAWSDGLTTWKSFRIPYHANTTPEYEDKPMTYDLAAHALGIGMTGWDWKARKSIWFAYDFDAIVGHSDKHAKKMTDAELEDVKRLVRDIPWVTLRTSTGGKGLHVYVFLANPVETANHHEHAALARAVLSNLSALCAFDFQSKVDICGGNMWVWHRKMMNGDTKIGLQLIKQGEKLDKHPENWRDHINVVRGRSTKTRPAFIESTDTESVFNELTSQRSRTPLDNEHKRLLDCLQNRGAMWWWDQDHWMLVTHTTHLKEAHNVLNLRGVFETISSGTERGADHNCFAYPLPRGAWAVRRYSPGCKEADTWEQDGSGWTKCFFNREMDFDTACKTAKGVEHPKGGYHFDTLGHALRAVNDLGAGIEVPSIFHERTAIVNRHKQEDKVIITFARESSDTGKTIDGWIQGKKDWTRVVHVRVPPKIEGESEAQIDDLVRHLITPNCEDAGWVIKSEGRWHQEPLQHIRVALDSMDYNMKEGRDILGGNIFKPWRLVNRPFQPEYPGDRTWNRDAAQLRFTPNPEIGSYRTWQKILDHCGAGLDEAVANNEWCRQNGIAKGAEYLKCWIASLIKEPHEPLPYLFFFGDQNSGKSSFHEAITLLFTRGAMRADTALTSQSGFNGELENVVLAVVEETDLKKNTTAYGRIKDWVTSLQISIHRKQRTPYMVPNTTHWVQCANGPEMCPVFPGDTRITMVHVGPLTKENLIAKKELIKLLEKEAPDFLAALLAMELPYNNERLNLPVLETQDKKDAATANATDVELFIQEKCFETPGTAIPFSTFFERFCEWLPPAKVGEYTKWKVQSQLPSRFPRGLLTSNPNTHIGNLTFNPEENPSEPYHKVGRILRKIHEDSGTRTPQANGQGHLSTVLSNGDSPEQPAN